ncbi:hypothetical protein ABZP36_034267 [Zizania latifolia]
MVAAAAREATMASDATAEVDGDAAPLEIDDEEEFVEIVVRDLGVFPKDMSCTWDVAEAVDGLTVVDEELLVVADDHIGGEDGPERVEISAVELEPNPWVPVRRLYGGICTEFKINLTSNREEDHMIQKLQNKHESTVL